MKFPDQFEFTNTFSGINFMLTKLNVDGCYMWRCNHLDDLYDWDTARYTKEQLESNFTSGQWITDADLSNDHELVYPFTFQTNNNSDNPYTVDKINGVIKFSDTLETEFGDDLYPESTIKKFIKSGAWIVKSVGKPLEAQTTSVSEAEAPTSDDNIIKLGSFQFDNKAALESIKALTGAVNDLAHAYDYLNAAIAIYEKRKIPNV